MIISELIRQEYSGEVYNITKIKINRNFNAFADLTRLNSKYLGFVSLQGASWDAGTDFNVHDTVPFARKRPSLRLYYSACSCSSLTASCSCSCLE